MDFLERLHVGGALLTAAAVDVQVREDPQQPRAQVRPRLERTPAAERPRIRLLHQVLGLVARADEMAGDSIDLIRQCKRVLLETHAVARFSCELPSVGLPSGFAHLGPPYQGVLGINVRLSTLIPGTENAWKRTLSSAAPKSARRSPSRPASTTRITIRKGTSHSPASWATASRTQASPTGLLSRRAREIRRATSRRGAPRAMSARRPTPARPRPSGSRSRTRAPRGLRGRLPDA